MQQKQNITSIAPFAMEVSKNMVLIDQIFNETVSQLNRAKEIIVSLQKENETLKAETSSLKSPEKEIQKLKK